MTSEARSSTNCSPGSRSWFAWWIEFQDTHGLRSFLERAHYHAPFGILVTQLEAIPIQDPRIVCLPSSSLLSLR